MVRMETGVAADGLPKDVECPLGIAAERRVVRRSVEGDLEATLRELENPGPVIGVLECAATKPRRLAKREWPDGLRSQDAVLVEKVVDRSNVLDRRRLGVVDDR